MTTHQTIIIGAGIAGLTAAYQLKKAGIQTLVLDENDYVGGRMFTIDWEGFRVDGGAKFVTTSDRFLLGIVRELGLENELVKSEEGLTTTIYRDGKLHTANFLSIPSYLGWSGVSLKARLAMLKLIPHFLGVASLKNPYHLEQAPGPDDDVTFEQFFKSRISEEMFEWWAIPMFETMCSYHGYDVSRKAFLALMVSYLNADSVTFKTGIGALPEALAKQVTVELQAKVTHIDLQKDGSGATVTYMKDGATHSASANSIIVAIPGTHVLELLSDPRPAWQRFFPKVNYAPGALQYHICETDFQPSVIGTFVPRILKQPISAMGFEFYKDGRWLMLTDPSVSLYPTNEPDEALIARAVTVMVDIFPQLKDTFKAHKIFHWEGKVPTFRPGYLQALSDFWADTQEGPVYFCGDYFAGPSTGGALYSGKSAAERLLES
ncbi:MAG: FAD-dependent oxidoreductase [Anaerolineales bacterium]|nr:FAD-dependent oxidoreductase [Anaerolineales bacterium]